MGTVRLVVLLRMLHVEFLVVFNRIFGQKFNNAIFNTYFTSAIDLIKKLEI